MKDKRGHRTQAELIPLLISYAQQHLPHLRLTERSEIERVKKGCCIGFAYSLAQSIAKGKLESTLTVLDQLVDLEEPLKKEEPVANNADLDVLIISVVSSQSNAFAGPVQVVENFKDEAFINACQWLEAVGDTLFFGSNYKERVQDTHAIAITLASVQPRSYFLIDANGSAGKILNTVDTELAVATDEIKNIPKFVRTALDGGGSVISIHFLSFSGRILQFEKSEFYLNNLALIGGETRSIAQEVLKNLDHKAEINEIPDRSVLVSIGNSFYPEQIDDVKKHAPKAMDHESADEDSEDIADYLGLLFYPSTIMDENVQAEKETVIQDEVFMALLSQSFYPKSEKSNAELSSIVNTKG